MFPVAKAADSNSREHTGWTASPSPFSSLSFPVSVCLSLSPGTGPIFLPTAVREAVARLRQEASQASCPLGVYTPRWFPPP